MKLSFVICGIEHSGTTLVSDLFRQTPSLDSGFEVGVLLADSPRAFRDMQPFSENVLHGWGVTEEDLDYICDCESHEEFYGRLWERSSVVNRAKRRVFDKTPRYFHRLGQVLKRTRCPVIALYKDPRAIVASDYSRAKAKGFEAWFEDYAPKKLGYLKPMHDHLATMRKGRMRRALAVSLEEICLDTRRSLEKIFCHAGEEFRLDYLTLKNLRYAHTRAPYVSSNIPFEYLGTFSKRQLAAIEESFSEVPLFFYG